jgi:hypothetical protein
MIGGTVIEVVDLATKVYINVAERPYNKIETCAIYVERNENSEKIEIGDQIWWQGGFAMWTPAKNRNPNLEKLKCGVDYDIQIQRVGFSGVNPPYNLKGK